MREETESKAMELIGIALECCSFFCDQHGSPYAFAKNPGRTMQLRAREFKVWLVKRFYDNHGQAVGSDAISAALNVLEAKASEAERIELSTRCSMEGDRLLVIDLANKAEEVVSIEPGAWGVKSLDRPRFRRYSHMLPMRIGSEGADIKEFARYWRLKDSDDDILLVGWIGHSFISEIPHAILTLIGPKGSTKTTATRAVRQLVDPSSVNDLTIGDKGKEFVQQLAHHYVPNFDNVSKLQPWQADDLCRASTGAGLSRRALYTDEEDVIFQFRRPVELNGINTPSQRGDFLDRTLLLECARVPKGERLEDTKVQAEVARWLPPLRRSVFDGLAKALALVDGVRSELKDLPRMADFAIWGEAFCRGVGYPPLEFYNRLMQKVDENSTVALENDVVAELLFKLMDDQRGAKYLTAKDEYEGTASTLLKVLQQLNHDLDYVSDKELPSTPESLGRRLGELAADLEEVGIRITRGKRTGKKRSLLVQTCARDGGEIPSQPSQPPPESGRGRSDSSDGDDGSPSARRGEGPEGGVCEVCKKNGGRPLVRSQGVVYLHPDCDSQWSGDL
jgi:hypothetical protein